MSITNIMALDSPKDIVRHVLTNVSDLDIVKEHVAPDATYVSLNYKNPDLQKIEPWCGTHEKVGPDGIHKVFVDVGRSWTTQAFDIYTAFGEGEDVAVFGKFVFKANTTGKITDSPFAVWAKVDPKTKLITYMQFMEDTLSTAASFKTHGKMTFCSNPDTREEVEVDFENIL